MKEWRPVSTPPDFIKLSRPAQFICFLYYLALAGGVDSKEEELAGISLLQPEKIAEILRAKQNSEFIELKPVYPVAPPFIIGRPFVRYRTGTALYRPPSNPGSNIDTTIVKIGSREVKRISISIEQPCRECMQKQVIATPVYEAGRRVLNLEDEMTVLKTAVASNQVSADQIGRSGNSLALLAVGFGDTAGLDLALRQGADVNFISVNDESETALIRASNSRYAGLASWF